MKEFGSAINQLFESQMAYLVWDNGLGNVFGRDIVCIMIGIGIGILFTLSMLLIEYLEDKWRKRNER